MASVGEPSHRKRPHIVTEKMMEFIRTQGDTSPNKQRCCPVEGCTKVLTSAPGLRYHIQTNHRDIKEYTCTGCKKIFKSSNGLKYHMNKHKQCSSESTESSTNDSIQHISDSSTSQTTSGANLDDTQCEARGKADTANLDNKAAPSKKFIPPPLVLFPTSVKEILDPNSVRHVPVTSSPLSSIPSLPTERSQAQRNQSATTFCTSQYSTTIVCSDSGKQCDMVTMEERSGDSRLIEFANIATGPQSPLLQHPKKPLESSRSVIRTLNMDMKENPVSQRPHVIVQQRDSKMEVDPHVRNDNYNRQQQDIRDSNGNFATDGSDSRVTSSSPVLSSPRETTNTCGTWSHNWPTAIWQCFIKDVLISFISENGVSRQPWVQVEVLARRDSLTARAARIEHPNQPNLRYAPNGLKIQQISKYSDLDNKMDSTIHIRFTPDVLGQLDLVASCPEDHPFFVKDKGWSSVMPEVTAKHYGIPCNELSMGDICLPPSHPDATFSNNVFQSLKSYDLTPQDSSAILTLSSMAKHKRDIEHSSPTKKRPPKPADPLKAKRPMNAFMLFAQEMRVSLTKDFPGRDNRSISVMLGDRWKKMTLEEKSIYEEKAKTLAEEQKKKNPDCWKRKK